MKSQRGLGVLETLTGLLVLMLVVLMGTKAYKNVVANHKEAAHVKGLTDAVTVTAEKLGGLTLAVLAGPGSPHLAWSEPAMVGMGPYHYRYRIVPSPKVGGKPDTAVVGLEVEAGVLEGGIFTASRTFATLIPPNLSSKGALGSVSTKVERDAEESFHNVLLARIDDLTERVVPENQRNLNSFSCYDPGQCCGFMRKYFGDLGIAAEDGLEEKCLYRCATGGDVSVARWNEACGMDFCAVSPWKGKPDCCKAIADGSCKTGSVCARICIECFGVDGSTCGPPPCEPYYWNDLFDCERGTYCDGSPLPDGDVPGWGNVKAWCKQPECRSIVTTCSERVADCCENYWRPLKAGQPIPLAFEVCAKITSHQDCCNWMPRMGHWNLHCGTDGRLKAAQIVANGQWYCSYPTPNWDGNCAMMQGCGSTVAPPGSPGGGCQSWTGPPYESPWVDPITGVSPGGVQVGDKGGTPGGKISTGGNGGGGRTGSARDGDGGEGSGGRE